MNTEPPVECCITCCVPEEPVTAPCGHTFELAALEQWKKTHINCPICNEELPSKKMAINVALRDMIQAWYGLQKKVHEQKEEIKNLETNKISTPTDFSTPPKAKNNHEENDEQLKWDERIFDQYHQELCPGCYELDENHLDASNYACGQFGLCVDCTTFLGTLSTNFNNVTSPSPSSSQARSSSPGAAYISPKKFPTKREELSHFIPLSRFRDHYRPIYTERMKIFDEICDYLHSILLEEEWILPEEDFGVLIEALTSLSFQSSFETPDSFAHWLQQQTKHHFLTAEQIQLLLATIPALSPETQTVPGVSYSPHHNLYILCSRMIDRWKTRVVDSFCSSYAQPLSTFFSDWETNESLTMLSNDRQPLLLHLLLILQEHRCLGGSESYDRYVKEDVETLIEKYIA